MKTKLFKILLTTPLLFTSPIIADKVTDPIDTAIQAYKEKDYKTALEELKYATAELQKLDTAENNKLLPEALEGWSMEIEDTGNRLAMNMLGGGQMIKAEYKNKNERIEIQIVANSPLISTVAMMVNNPMFSNAKGKEPFRYKKIKGVKEKQGTNSSITLLIAGQIMIKLEGNNLKDDKVLEAYLDRMDMKKIKNTLLR